MTRPTTNDDATAGKARGVGETAVLGEALHANTSTRFGALRNALRDRDLLAADVRVYAALLDQNLRRHSDGAITCRPSHKRLAIESGIHPQSIRRSIRHLEARGYINQQPSAGGRGRTNTYALLGLNPCTHAGVSAENPGTGAPQLLRKPVSNARGALSASLSAPASQKPGGRNEADQRVDCQATTHSLPPEKLLGFGHGEFA